ncbi:POTRA domain-containing protein [Paraglaciecola aquimarina]|uniref:POTRA domain-containing protein n=1 Tax=Paraglaciecola aquimarina TaxID=1235557 RepID=A0ABU3SX12_9ALTE|nr:POTRA domain-containing protein [Paraglaciecola aquimarina]MDU0354544.1 POTRA domain-containing protein [Paraglaciecola aquimarina]
MFIPIFSSIRFKLLGCIVTVVFSLVFSLSVVAGELKITGVDNDKVRENIEVVVASVSLPQHKSDFEQYQQTIIEKASKAAQVYGYYGLQFTFTAAKSIKDDWQLQIKLGEVTKIRNLSIKVNGQAGEDKAIQKLLAGLPLKTAQPLDHSAYESAKGQIQSLALSRGFFDFEYTESSIKVYESLHAADVTLHVSSGNRYRFGELKFGQDLRASSLAKSLVPFQAGDFYLSGKLGLFNQLLKQTQYFRNVVVRPIIDDAENFQVPIQVILTHKPRDNFDVGIGASSDEGPRFTGKWRRPWVNSHGHSVGGDFCFCSRTICGFGLSHSD